MMRTGADFDIKTLGPAVPRLPATRARSCATTSATGPADLADALGPARGVDRGPRSTSRSSTTRRRPPSSTDTERFGMGLCACRHEHEHHLGAKPCQAPLDNCSTFGAIAVDFMVRNGLAREVSKTEMLDNLAPLARAGPGASTPTTCSATSPSSATAAADCCHVLARHQPATATQRGRDLQLRRRLRPRASATAAAPAAKQLPDRRHRRASPTPSRASSKFGRPQVDESTLPRLRRVHAHAASRAR
ncbi:MAG: hypothetical protein MZV70_17140 [Desulfobacterales bacterium]|nr:hypothetical protein [Desulfobacterales bacterium]